MQDDADATIATIQTKDGKTVAKLTMDGGVAAEADTAKQHQSASTAKAITFSTITGAQENGKAAKYYDKDGNGIPANALDKYFTASVELMVR